MDHDQTLKNLPSAAAPCNATVWDHSPDELYTVFVRYEHEKCLVLVPDSNVLCDVLLTCVVWSAAVLPSAPSSY